LDLFSSLNALSGVRGFLTTNSVSTKPPHGVFCLNALSGVRGFLTVLYYGTYVDYLRFSLNALSGVRGFLTARQKYLICKWSLAS